MTGTHRSQHHTRNDQPQLRWIGPAPGTEPVGRPRRPWLSTAIPSQDAPTFRLRGVGPSAHHHGARTPREVTDVATTASSPPIAAADNSIQTASAVPSAT